MMKRIFGKTNATLATQILFTVLAFAVMVLLSYIFMGSVVRGSLIRNAESVLGFAQERISDKLGDASSALDFFAETARDMVLHNASAAEIQEYVNATSYNARLFGEKSLNIADFYGYFETLPGGPALIHGNFMTAPDGQNPGEWYKPAIEAGGDTAETVPYINGTQGTLFTYSKCIFDDEGRRLGVMCIDVQLDTIGQEVVETALNQGGYGMLVNQDFLILSHPNRDFDGRYVYDPVVPLSVNVAGELQAGHEIFEMPMTSYKGEAAVVFFRKLPNGWYVGLVTPKGQFYQSTTSMAAVLCLLGITLALALIGILIRIDRARARSDEENRQKSMFLANMSHEIRTPINAIVGMTAIGRATGTVDRKDYCFSKIDDASKHLLGVINDILDISKIEANKIELSPTEFNFEKMLQQVVNVVNFRIDEKRQKLTVQIDKAIPKILVADDQRFAQVITNLLSNAVKFTPEEGLINLQTSLQGQSDGVYTLKVAVTDTGIGISPEQQSRLFQSFQQAESSTTRRYGGTGLGLSISKSIVEMMGGTIWAESELGKGTTIAFTVKAQRGDESNFSLSYRGINWKNIRILTVDDDPDILVYFQEIVSSFGAHCEVASGAEEALRLVEQNGVYNIYFIDLRMPGIDGIGLTKEIRAREANPGNSIVIMISSADLSAIESEAKKAGVNRFLLKPLFPSSIADVISECIGIVNEKTDEAPLDINGIFAGRRILFAEDIDINREIVQALLEPTLIEIDCAENGMEAVNMFNKTPEKYEMIFMDVQMPEMDGYEATRQIRALNIPQAKTVPIVAMTANVFKEDIANCIASGMNGHLGKPLDMNDLLETTLKYLGKGAAANGASEKP